MSTIIDLSQELFCGMPAWNLACGFHSHVECTHEKNGLATHVIEAPMGIGTHIDAPYHFNVDGIAIDQLPFSQLVAPAIVIHWQPAHSDSQFTLSDLQKFEAEYGVVTANSLVLFDSGWGEKWRNVDQYRNVGTDGKMHFPTIHVNVAKALAEKGVVGLGVDTLSPDPDNDIFNLHRFWLAQNKVIIENLANLDLLPTHGAMVYALPLKIEGAAEAPARVIAVL